MGAGIKFGTDGWRAVIARDFTFENLRLVTQSIGLYLKNNSLDKSGIFIGYDNRFLSEEFGHEAAKVLSIMGLKIYISEEAAEALALRVAKGTSGQSPLDLLSTRELQVLRRLAMGHTNREIAENYHISIKTVDTYRLRLLKKLSLRNNAELSRFAIQNRLIET